MSEEILEGEQPLCDPEFDEDCVVEEMSAPYTQEDGQMAVLYYGIIAIVNAFTPSLLWFFWKRGGLELNEKSLIWWGWYGAWILHASLWGVPALLFPFTYLGVDFVNYFYVFWANLIVAAPFSLYWLVAMVFLLAAILFEEPNMTDQMEHWLTFAAYAIIAGGTSFIQLWQLQNLNMWYYLDGLMDMEPEVIEEEVEELDDNGY